MNAHADARFRADIEGLRAIAVAAVVLFHADVSGFAGGYVGVDVFFVISGFLITRQLLADDDASAIARIRHFYVRRIRRILPAATATIVVTLALAALMRPPLLRFDDRGDGVAAMFFTSNLRFASRATDYFHHDGAPSLFQHYWSLSIEEQFYVLWPAVLVLSSLAALRHRKAVRGGVVALILVLSLAASVVLTRDNATTAFYSLPARAWELSAGALIAIWARPLVSSVRNARLLQSVGLAAIVAAIATYGSVTEFPGAYALLPVLGTALVIVAGLGSRVADTGLLALRPMQILGRYSYSVYLWHWPALVLAEHRWPGVSDGTIGALGVVFVAALPAAVVSYHLVEQPFRVRSARSADRTMLLGGAGILAAGAAFLALYGAVGFPDLHTDRRAASAADGSLAATSFVPANLTPTLRSAFTAGNESRRACPSGLRACVIGDPDADVVIVLFGDSHAMHWLGAFDEAGKANGWRVEARVFPGCSSFVHPPAVEGLPCDAFRAGAIALIEETKPDLVVMSNSVLLPLQELGAKTAEGIRRGLASLPRDVPVAVLGQTPTAEENVPVCLSAHLSRTEECEPGRGDGRVREINALLGAAASEANASFIDATPLVCEQRCPTVVGNLLVYRDDDHVTYAFARTRAATLTQLLLPVMR